MKRSASTRLSFRFLLVPPLAYHVGEIADSRMQNAFGYGAWTVHQAMWETGWCGERRAPKQASHRPWKPVCEQIGTTKAICWQRLMFKGQGDSQKSEWSFFIKKGTLYTGCWVMNGYLPRWGGVKRVTLGIKLQQTVRCKRAWWGIASPLGRQIMVCVCERQRRGRGRRWGGGEPEASREQCFRIPGEMESGQRPHQSCVIGSSELSLQRGANDNKL